MKYDSFILDLDGTLCDTLKDIAYSVNYALKKYNLKTHSLEKYKSFVGNGSNKLIQRAIYPHEELFNKVFKTYKEKYLSNPTKYTKPYKGMERFLLEAKKQGIKLFVFTNKPHDLATSVLSLSFKDNIFTKIIGIQNNTQIIKPQVDNFLKETKEYNINYSLSAYFGDSDVDIFTANNLRVKETYITLWGYQDKKHLESLEIKPTKYISKINELYSLL